MKKLAKIATGATAYLYTAGLAIAAPEVPDPGGVQSDLGELVRSIANLLLGVVGFVALIMLLVGALRYIASAGSSTAVEGAKNTILYAVIGIIIAAAAFAIVNFVLPAVFTG